MVTRLSRLLGLPQRLHDHLVHGPLPHSPVLIRLRAPLRAGLEVVLRIPQHLVLRHRHGRRAEAVHGGLAHHGHEVWRAVDMIDGPRVVVVRRARRRFGVQILPPQRSYVSHSPQQLLLLAIVCDVVCAGQGIVFVLVLGRAHSGRPLSTHPGAGVTNCGRTPAAVARRSRHRPPLLSDVSLVPRWTLGRLLALPAAPFPGLGPSFLVPAVLARLGSR
mmetsp:Transcript_5480/g.13733  ORF Transcript_5480/g.13733 Transcript_5480/m.13733 type:complete len:218 (-) Transcript_5480:1015-1668(-)